MSSLKHGGKRHVPLPKGPYTVGCTDIMTGHSINGCFFRLFYPCAESGTLEHMDQWPLWEPNKLYRNGHLAYSKFPKFMVRKIFSVFTGNMYIPAILDATPLVKEAPYPLIVFSHGLLASKGTYTSIVLELASCGYVVACVEHRDGSACHTFYIKQTRMSMYGPSPGTDISELGDDIMDREDDCDDMEKYRSAPIEKRMHGAAPNPKQSVPFFLRSISKKHAHVRNKQVHRRAKECSRILDLFEDINNGCELKNVVQTNFKLDKLYGLVDTSRVGIAGHSFGGATTLMTLSTDPRFSVGVTFDLWTVPIEMEDLSSYISQPVLFINTGHFQSKQSLKELKKFESNKTDRKFFTIKGTVHLSQCDMAFILPKLCFLLEGQIIHGNIITHTNINNRLMLTFLAKHLSSSFQPNYDNYLKSKFSKIKEGIIIKQKHFAFPWNSRGTFEPTDK